jgi:hypothetical protein
MMSCAIFAANLSDAVIVVSHFVIYFLALEFPVLQFHLFHNRVRLRVASMCEGFTVQSYIKIKLGASW